MSAPPTLALEVPIDLVKGRPPLNANDRMHWARKASLTQAVRETTAWRVKAHQLQPARHLTVQLHYAPGDRRKRRDPANLCATSKPAIDGLVDAGLVPDDTPEWVTELMPVIEPGPQPRRLWLEVTIHPKFSGEAA